MKTGNLGMDFAKDTVRCTLLIGKVISEREFPNHSSEAATILEWLRSYGLKRCHVVFEPTGRYPERLIGAMWHCPGIRIFEANPEKASLFAKSLDVRHKTDATDAYALARMACERAEDTKVWQPKTDLGLELRDVQLMLLSIKKRIVMLKNQRKCGLTSTWVRDEIADELRQLDEKEKKCLEYASKLIKSEPNMRRDFELLLSIKGIAEKTAVLMLCYIDFRKFTSSRKLVCFLGITQRKHQSGTSIKGKERISKKGSTIVRSELHYPTWSAINTSPSMAEFYARLVSKGKDKSVAKTACTRKLIQIAWAVVYHQRPFDPAFENVNSRKRAG
jgi:transposase